MPVLNSYTFSPSKMFILLRFLVLSATVLAIRADLVESDEQAMVSICSI